MSAGPPRPRPWPAGEAKTVGKDGVRRLTVPAAWQMYTGVLNYHAPQKLRDADLILSAIPYAQ